MKVVVVIIMPLTRLDFYNFTFSIIRDASAGVIKKTSFYLYSNNVSNLVLRDKRINAIVTL